MVFQVTIYCILQQEINMASTKNVKGDRKMLHVRYYAPINYYRIPDNLDLEDKSVVEEYWVKWNTLYIKYVGKEEAEKINPEYSDTDGDIFKHPETLEIVDAEEHYVEYDDEIEEEDVIPCPDCYEVAYAAASATDGVGVENMQVMCDCDENKEE